MADYGLLLGLTEGLKSGMQSYNQERDRQRTLDEKIEERKRQAQKDKMDAYQGGLLTKEDGSIAEDPNNPNIQRKLKEIEDKNFQNKAGLLEKGIIQGPTGAPEFNPQAKAKNQAEIDLKNAQADFYKNRPASKTSGLVGGTRNGRPLTVGASENLAGSNSALQSLGDMKSLTKANPEMFGKGVGLLGSLGVATGIGDTATKAASIDADLMSKAQVIGRYLEGGKLAEGDIHRYSKMLPQRGDKPEIVANKIATLERMVEQKYNSDRSGYQKSGYDIGGNEPMEVSQGLIGGVGKQGAGPKAGIVESGYQFMGGDPADKSNWKKVK